MNLILKKSCQVAFSLGLQRTIQAVMNFIGMLMVARLGHQAIAASALIFMVQMLASMFGGAFLSCIGIKTAQLFGAKKYKDIGKCFRNGIVLALGLSLILDTIIWNIGPILLFFHQPPATVLFAQKFFNIYLVIVPLFTIFSVLVNMVISVDKKRFFLIIFAICTVVWLLLSYALIFGHFGMPKLGLEGYAYAMLISTVLSVIIYGCYFIFSNYFKQFELKAKSSIIEWSFIKELIKIGFPIGTHVFSIAFFGIVTTIMVGWLGSGALAVQQIIGQYFLLLVTPVLAIAQASTVLVAQAHGAKNHMDAKRYANTTLFISLVFTAIVMIALLVFPHALIHFYVGGISNKLSEPLMKLAAIVLMITASRLVFDAILENRTGSLRGISDVKFPAWLNILMTWPVLLPMSYVTMFTLNWGLIGLNSCFVAGYLIQAIILGIRWKRQSHSLTLTQQEEVLTS